MAGRWKEQGGFQLRFGWGEMELAVLGPVSDVLVIVDVLRFTSAVTVAVERGAEVLPYRWRDSSAGAFAAEHGALLAGNREDGSWSLSPTDLQRLPAGSRLVLPSPNGATLSLLGAAHCRDGVIAGALRNAAAVGERLADTLRAGGTVSVIAAGERDGAGLRPSVEDQLGAGAVLAESLKRCAVPISPEGRSALAVFQAAESTLEEWLSSSASGRELIELGWRDDVEIAAKFAVSGCVPIFDGLAFRDADGPRGRLPSCSDRAAEI